MIFADCLNVVLLLWILFLLSVFHVYLCYAVLSVPCSIVVTCWERFDLLALLCIVFSCSLVTFSYGVPGEGPGTGLYLFLIFAFFSI